MTTWVVGDLQGCAPGLERLLERLRFDPVEDELWCVGDLVNRGGRSLEVLRLLHGLRDCVTAVLGNHDLHLLRRAARAPGLSGNAELDRVLAAPDADALLGWLRGCPLLHVDHGRAAALVHAGIHPGWSLERAESEARALEGAIGTAAPGADFERLWGAPEPSARSVTEDPRFSLGCFVRMRFVYADGRLDLDANGPPATAPDGAWPWYAWPGRIRLPVHVWFGHWASLGLYRGNGVTGLDSGFVWGGQLTAIDVEDPRRMVQIEASGDDAPGRPVSH